MRTRKNWVAAVFTAAVLTAGSAMAADVFVLASERENRKLVKVDVTPPFTAASCTARTGSPDCIIVLHTTAVAPDSMLLDPQGRIIYSQPTGGVDSLGDIRRFDPVALTDVEIANSTNGVASPQDLVLDPTNTTLYVANFDGNAAGGTITKTNLATLTTTLCGHIPFPEGMVFVGARFFVLAGFGTPTSGIYELNPNTCTVIQSNTGFDSKNELDSLAYDSSTNRLFATSSGVIGGGSSSVYSIDPTTLGLPAVKIATVPDPDGIISNSGGLLYVASRSGLGTGAVYSVNESTFAVTPLTPVPTIDDLSVAPPGPPIGGKTFSFASVVQFGTSTVTITITNPNLTANLAGVGFTDTPLPTGVVVATPPNVVNTTCGGNFNPPIVANATSVIYTGGTLAPGASCTVQFDVTDNNTTGTVSQNCVTATSTNGGNDTGPFTVTSGRCSNLTVNVPSFPLTTTKVFGAPSIPSGTPTTMTITVTNPAPNPAANNIAFADTFPPAAPLLAVANPANASTTCAGGTVTAVALATSISLAGASLPAGPSFCTVTVSVTGGTTTVPALQTNTTSVGSAIVNAITVPVNTSTAQILVTPPPLPPSIAKSFALTSLPVFETTTLTFLITNPNPALTLTGINFTDPLPVGLVVATPANVAGTCNGTVPTALAGTNSIIILAPGATLPPLGSCTFSVDVTAVLAGAQVNTTFVVGSTNPTQTGNSATASLNVDPPPDAYQINYIPNLNIGNGAVNLSNAGSLGADRFGPGVGPGTGKICANVYVFEPDEQEIACCTCLVTPNALVNLRGQDLVSNTLTGIHPTSIVVKLLFTVPGDPGTGLPGTQAGPFTNSSCNAAFPFGVTNLAPGGRAWVTKLHSLPTSPTTYGITEDPFIFNPINFGTINQLTVQELTKLTNLCQFIAGNGSGTGICKSCVQSSGALGGAKQ
jgi:hypothetical protein